MSETSNSSPKAGAFCWTELNTSDKSGSERFYAQLFGWTAELSPAGERRYTLFKSGDTVVGGMLEMSGAQFEGVPNHWLSYVAVDDVDASASKAESLGAKICCPPTDIPNIGRFAVITDPAGASIGLYKASS